MVAIPMTNGDAFQAIRLRDRAALLAAIEQYGINVRSNIGENLLHQAIANGWELIAEHLISHGIDVNHQTETGSTPLHFAAERQNEIIARLALAAGARLDTADRHGNQPLWTAVFNARGDYRVVSLFMANGADPLHKNRYGKSPRDFASQIGDIDMIGLLDSKQNT